MADRGTVPDCKVRKKKKGDEENGIENETEAPFTLVEKKKKKKRRKVKEGTAEVPAGPGTGTAKAGPGPETQRTTAAQRDRRRPRSKHRPEAVLINPGKTKSSGEVLRALRSKLSPEDFGSGVRAIRTARNGDLLLEFEGSIKDRSALEKKITEAVGSDVGVRHLVPTTTEQVVRHFEGEIVIGGHFNAKSVDWGMEYSDTRENELLDMMASLDLSL